jgi:hypothetical protein
MWECFTSEAYESAPAGTVVRNDSRWSISNILHCQYEEIIETYANQLLETALHEVKWSSKPLKFQNCTLGVGSRYNFLLCWAEIVDKYTNCDITKRSDRLAALSGIINRIQEVVGFDCFYGIWDMPGEWMAQQLLWSPSILKGIKPPVYPRPKQRDAPSGSWIAVDGPVEITNPSKTITTYRGLKALVEEAIHVGMEMVEILEFPNSSRDGSQKPLRLRGKVLSKPRHEISTWHCTLDTSEPIRIYPSDVFFLLVFNHNPSFHPGEKRKEKDEQMPSLTALILIRILGGGTEIYAHWKMGY